MSRAFAILDRLPAHLEPTRPGKLLGDVTAALARDLDVLAAQLAAVRRARRLGEADELADLHKIAALHGIQAAELDLLTLRFERAAARLATLLAVAERPAAQAAAEALLELWGLDVTAPRLAAFAVVTPGEPLLDLDGAAGTLALERLQASVGAALRYSARVAAARTRIARICRRHAAGNATVAALLEGAAGALDLDLGPLEHTPDRFMHAAFAHDRLRLTPPPLPPRAGETAPQPLPPLAPATEVLGLVENPLRRAGTDGIERRSGERFDLVRRGFERALLQVRVSGTGDAVPFTCGPMLVNRDEGHGVGFADAVAPGATLVFDENGRVTLDSADVTARAFAFKGAVFADAAGASPRDFGFDGEAAGFAEAFPPGALDREFAFPHAGVSLPMPGVAVGVTRFAFFVRDAHFAAGDPDAGPLPATPRPFQAVFDESVLTLGSGAVGPAAARVALSWLEHEAYKVRVMIPPRLRALEDDPEATLVRRRLAQALERFRPAGVALEVAFVDDRWVLGEGVLGVADGSPLAALVGGIALWPAAGGPD